MIKISFIFLAILLCQNSFCQDSSLENNTVTIVENKKADFLYRGIKNTLKIYMVGVDSSNVDHRAIKKDLGNGEFVIIPGKEDKITLIIRGYKKGIEIVEEKTFRVIDMIRLHGSINGQFKTLEMEKEKLLKERVECVSPNFVYSPPAYHFTVHEFSFKINQK